jgi:pathogenesis-related protein 1
MKKLILLSFIIFAASFVSSGQKVIKLTPEQIKQFVTRHNYWRKMVGSADVKWNQQIADWAADWALGLAKKGCNMQHRPNNKYGENIFWASGMSVTPDYAVDSWGEEKKFYKGEKITGSNYSKFGHYTQMIWYNTTEIGCAIVTCAGGQTLVVCNYNPPGNYIGQKASGK